MSYLIIGLEGATLSDIERDWLARDEVGGAILFSHNFESVDQWVELCEAIRDVDPDAICCVDQEGGRVQRLRDPATSLPSLAAIGKRFDVDEGDGLDMAMIHGQLMASEMLALGMDLSFAPVLDLGRHGEVIGDRAFHEDPEAVKLLGRAYVKGMHQAGMAACGKHFPGHGSVEPDTHRSRAVDDRPFDEIAESDMLPFTAAIRDGLDAVMMAHVIYPAVDDMPAGYSRTWIQDILRERIGFEGAVISDDLGMAAAAEIGGFQARLEQAMGAGCDFVLICRPQDVAEAFGAIRKWPAMTVDRREALRALRRVQWSDFAAAEDRQLWRERLGVS